MTTAFETARLLDALAQAGELVGTEGDVPALFLDLTEDSRHVRRGSLFIALRGSSSDGHAFLGNAAESGATAAIVERRGATTLPHIVVRHGRRAAGIAAVAAFDDPASDMTVVGVTGTNGKTTTVGMLRHLLDDAEAPAASIGTLGVLVGSEGEALPGSAALTTPGVIDLHRTLRALRDRGVRKVAMEVSSHALDQRRVDGVAFAGAVFTNVTRDHLDYHGTMEAYLSAKASLIDRLSPDGVAVINNDDPVWRALSPRRRVLFGFAEGADVTARGVSWTAAGSAWDLCAGGQASRVLLPLLGAFNVSNALGAAACAWALGAPLDTIAARLSSMPQVPGRLERLLAHPAVLRDYAHTPDALERALDAVRPFTRGRLIVLFGCGGDRDRGKRPLMGRVAAAKADYLILTSDNPRTEDPERILDEIEAGVGDAPHVRIEDRRAAIEHALRHAGHDDLVLLAGKGHETYQIRGKEVLPFDERLVVAELAAAGAATA